MNFERWQKMKYKIEFKPRALKDCRKISKSQLAHIGWAKRGCKTFVSGHGV